MNVRSITKVSHQDIADLLESAVATEAPVDLGPVVLVKGTCQVTGHFIALTTSEGTAAIIR